MSGRITEKIQPGEGVGDGWVEVLTEQPGESLSRSLGESEGATSEVSGGRTGCMKGGAKALWLNLGPAPGLLPEPLLTLSLV